MNALCRNCQGTGNAWTVQGLKGLLALTISKILFLSETRCNKVEMERIKFRLGYSSCIVVDCATVETRNGKGIRRAGGLCMMWQRDIKISLLSFSHNHIDVVVGEVDSFQWRFTGFYGEPITNKRETSWRLLRNLTSQYNLPWLVGGDFNEIMVEDEKEGGAIRCRRQMEEFNPAAVDCGLQDLRANGPKYTWQGIWNGHVIKTRLDRFLVSESWHRYFTNSIARNLEPNKSDHYRF